MHSCLSAVPTYSFQNVVTTAPHCSELFHTIQMPTRLLVSGTRKPHEAKSDNYSGCSQAVAETDVWEDALIRPRTYAFSTNGAVVNVPKLEGNA